MPELTREAIEIILDRDVWREVAKALESVTPEEPGRFVSLKESNEYHARTRALRAIRQAVPKRGPRAKKPKTTTHETTYGTFGLTFGPAQRSEPAPPTDEDRLGLASLTDEDRPDPTLLEIDEEEYRRL